MLISPPIARDLSRYNSRDRRSLSTHLSEFLMHVFDPSLGGPRVHCINARDSSHSPSNDPYDAMCSEIKIKEEVLSHTEKNNAN